MRAAITIQDQNNRSTLLVQHEDGIYNIDIYTDDMLEHVNIAIDHKQANALIDFLYDTGTPLETIKTYTVDELHIQDGEETTRQS